MLNESTLEFLIESDYTNNVLKQIDTIEKLDALIDTIPNQLVKIKTIENIQHIVNQLGTLWRGIHSYHYYYFFQKWEIKEELSNDTKTIISLCKNDEKEVNRITERLNKMSSASIQRKHYLETIKPRNVETGRKRMNKKIICDNCGGEYNELTITKHRLSKKCNRGGKKINYNTSNQTILVILQLVKYSI